VLTNMPQEGLLGLECNQTLGKAQLYWYLLRWYVWT
jgi:hypothetical protein